MSGVELHFAIKPRKATGLSAKITQAIAQGLNEGGDKVRTQVQRALKQQTGVKAYSSITSRMRTSRAYATGLDAKSGIGPSRPGRLSYIIIATGKGIPIKEFPVYRNSKGIRAKIWNVDHAFKRSFGIKGVGVEGYRMRLGSTRFPIRKFYGPSLPKELGRGVVPSVFTLTAAEYVPAAILKRLARVLQ